MLTYNTQHVFLFDRKESNHLSGHSEKKTNVREHYLLASISTLLSSGIRSSGIGTRSYMGMPCSTMASCFMLIQHLILAVYSGVVQPLETVADDLLGHA